MGCISYVPQILLCYKDQLSLLAVGGWLGEKQNRSNQIDK